MSNKCLNCNQSTEGNYCSNCSQKTTTHRLSIKHFFVHDFVHGILHVDKGFFFTIRELFIRPGHSIREYVQGKRINHFNSFATIILLLTIEYFFTSWVKVDVTNVVSKEGTSGLLKVLEHYSKIVIFLAIPFNAMVSYFLFRKTGQNYTENLVLNMYMLCGWLCISFLFQAAMIFISNVETLKIINQVVIALIFIYVFIFYYQYFSAFGYNKLSLAIRCFVIALVILTIKAQINNGLNEIGLRYFH